MMKRLLCFCSLLVLAQVSYAQTKNFIDQPYLETTARIDTLVTPNRIYLEIRLQESDSKGRTSLEQLEQQMGSALEDLGIDLKEQLTVSDLSSDFQNYFLRGQEILKEKIFELLLYDAPTAGRVLYEMEQMGISNVRLVKTAYGEMDTLEETLKLRAVKKAYGQGNRMAGALGQSLGKALFISDGGFSINNTLKERSANVMMRADEAGSLYAALPADIDKIRVQASVQIKFRLD